MIIQDKFIIDRDKILREFTCYGEDYVLFLYQGFPKLVRLVKNDSLSQNLAKRIIDRLSSDKVFLKIDLNSSLAAVVGVDIPFFLAKYGMKKTQSLMKSYVVKLSDNDMYNFFYDNERALNLDKARDEINEKLMNMSVDDSVDLLRQLDSLSDTYAPVKARNMARHHGIEAIAKKCHY